MWLLCHGYMCIVLYMKLIWCNGFAEIYAHLEDGVGSIYQRYMYIVIYIYIYIYIYMYIHIYIDLPLYLPSVV